MEKKRYEMPVMKAVKLKNSGRHLCAASDGQGAKEYEDSGEGLIWDGDGFEDGEGDN